MDHNDRLLTVREVAAVTRLSKPTIYKLVRCNDFPRQIQIGRAKVAWLRSEVLGWIDGRAAERGVT